LFYADFFRLTALPKDKTEPPARAETHFCKRTRFAGNFRHTEIQYHLTASSRPQGEKGELLRGARTRTYATRRKAMP